MRYFVLLLMFYVVLDLSASQPDNGTIRCLMPTRTNQVPIFCAEFYGNNGFFNASGITAIRRALDDIFLSFEAESVECVESLQQYLCYYYFPLCNLTTGEIIPVCNNSCNLLFNNDSCLDLWMLASEELGTYRIPQRLQPDQFCSSTYRSFMNPPPVSDSCKEIQVTSTTNNGGISTDSPDDMNNDISDDVITNNDSTDNSNNTVIIIGVVVAIFVAVAIITVIVIILLVVKRKGRRKEITAEEVSIDEPTGRYIVTQTSQPSHHDDPKETVSENSFLSEVHQLLQYVEAKFSDILLQQDVVTKLQLIGKGAFGIVHKGELKSTDGSIKAVAIKTIKSGSLDAMKDLVAESAIMKTFHHPNVLPLLGVCIDYNDEDVLKIVIPFMANGDLKTFLKNNRVVPSNTHEYSKNLSEEMLLRMCLDIARGMEYLAQRRFIHRDLAARNCMVDGNLTIRVADFGLTRDVYSTEYYRAEKHTTLPVKWMSLESLLDGYFDEKTDVWSYGVTCWEIFSLGRIPYPGIDNADVISFIKHGKRLEKPDLCPSTLFEIIETMWLVESDKRPSFTEIVQTLSSNVVESTTITSEESNKTTEIKNDNYIDLL